MGLIKEPENVDFSTISTPWTEEELSEFRKIMNEIKTNNAKRDIDVLSPKKEGSKRV